VSENSKPAPFENQNQRVRHPTGSGLVYAPPAASFLNGLLQGAHSNFAYSDFASTRMGMSGSASFHKILILDPRFRPVTLHGAAEA
jgi:hypothetical protein